LCTAGLLTLGFRAPHWRDALIVALAGVGNGIAQFWWTRSLSLAPPSAVVPFNYLSLVWATILGFAVWGDVPTPGLLVGSAIVVASGLYILWRETLRRRLCAGGTRLRTRGPRYMADAFETILVAWLAFAFLPERPTRSQGGTDGSNPLSSSGESMKPAR
jgi:hypothetical protein